MAYAPSPLKPLRDKPQEQPANTPGVRQDQEAKNTKEALPPWRQVTLQDLHDLTRLARLYDQAIAWRWLDRSPASWLACVTAAIHAAQRGREPGALFRYVLSHQAWEVLTHREEDAARAWLRRQCGELERAPEVPSVPSAPVLPALPADAQCVQHVQRLLRAQGWEGDPWPLLVQHWPDWTRARWQAALAALEHWQLVEVQARVAWRAGQVEDGDDENAEEDDEALREDDDL